MKKIHTEIIKNSNVNFFEMNNTEYEQHGLVVYFNTTVSRDKEFKIYINKEYFEFLETKYPDKINDYANSLYNDKTTFLKRDMLLIILIMILMLVVVFDYARPNFIINNMFLLILAIFSIFGFRIFGMILIYKSILNKSIKNQNGNYDKEFCVDVIDFLKNNETVKNKETILNIFEQILLSHTK